MITLRIKEICKQQGTTLNALAERIGVSQPSISGIATGRQKPSLDTIEKIASALNVSVSELFAAPVEGVITCPHCGKLIKLKAE